jgi:integrase
VRVSNKSAALRWGQERERHLLVHGPTPPRKKEVPPPVKEVPTLNEFAPKFIDGYAKANRQKPSGIAAKETIFRVHLLPKLGTKKLDAITIEQVQELKYALRSRSPKTVNNVLTTLNVTLKTAVDWDVIERMPCTIRLLKVPKPSVGFHDFDQYERLVEAAKAEPSAHLIVLLGGEAGLRCGEMMALEWTDIDWTSRQLCIRRSEWKGHVTAPKGGRSRYVKMTARLGKALHDHKRQRAPRVLSESDGSPLTMRRVQGFVRRAARQAGLTNVGVHVLRHTFCSRLAMLGAPARAIQELAGHQDLVTTQRYMHLSPAAIDSAIRLLDHVPVATSVAQLTDST